MWDLTVSVPDYWFSSNFTIYGHGSRLGHVTWAKCTVKPADVVTSIKGSPVLS